MSEHIVTANLKTRYFTLGKLNEHTKQIWFVLHGYGQLAKFFIQKFSVLEQHHIYVVAPEGLSNFYIEDVEKRAAGGSNRVGASWMTHENRLMDIENYITYLNTVYQTIQNTNTQNIPITVLGFSQGVATAARWVLNDTIKFERLILWAGILPPDMDFELGSKLLKTKEVIEVYGKTDPFINADRLTEMKKLFAQLHYEPRIIAFDGKHEMHDATLLSLI